MNEPSPSRKPEGMERLTHWEGEPVEVWRALWGLRALEVYEHLASTNDRAGELARDGSAGADGWTLVLSESQSRGRGRGGKTWVSPPGSSLLFSLVIPGRSEGWNALLPIRMGLAAASGLERSVGPREGPLLPVMLKWPNDLLWMGRKVGGILCERGGDGDLVAGMGINIRQVAGDFPEELRTRAASVEGVLGEPVARSRILGEILAQLRVRLGGGGPVLSSTELEEYSSRDFLAGKQVVSETEGGGTALGLTPRGHLGLRSVDGALRTVRGGSVFLPQ